MMLRRAALRVFIGSEQTVLVKADQFSRSWDGNLPLITAPRGSFGLHNLCAASDGIKKSLLFIETKF